MKTFKLLGIAVAALGIAASVGGAVALYTQAATQTTLGIGSGSYSGKTGKLTYKINGGTSGSVLPKYYSTGEAPQEGPGLSHEYSQVKYAFPLSATYASDLNAQTFVQGHLGISITDIPAKYQGHLTIWAGIEGYTEGKAGQKLFSNCFGSDYNITSEAASYVKGADISVAAAGGQTLVIWMKYSIQSSTDYLALDEEALGYTLSVSWGAPTEGLAYVVGTGNSWAINDDFAMAKNIEANYDTDEWVYNGLAADASWSKAKCVTGSGAVWSADPDADLTAGKTYDVYWAGNGEAQAYFDELK